MPSTAIHDFFRYIKLYSPDGSTLEQTLEADSVTDSLNLRRSDGVSWNVPEMSPGGTLAVTVGVDTIDSKVQGNLYIDGVEKKSITLVRGQTYIFDQSDATNAGYGGYNHPLVLSNTADGAISGAISGQEYTIGVTYLIDDVAVTKTDYKLDFTTTTNRKIKIELNDSSPTTLYYGTHDTLNQGGTVTTTTGSDLMQINVDYSLDVPPGTTNLELTDINSNTSHIELSATGGITLVRKNANEIEIGSFAVAETDTLHTVSTRNAITTNKLYIENIEVGNVTSATEDGFVSPSIEFLGQGTLDNPLRLSVAEREVTSNTTTQTFTFTAKNAPGILHYTIGHQLDSGTAATSVTSSIQKFNGITWDTLDTVTGVTGLPYEVSNMYNDTDSGSVYRVVYAIAGNTGTISLELQAYYEILEITDNPVIRTDTAVGTVWTRDLSPMGINDIGRGSEPYDNVYANTFHGHLQGTFDGDLTGSLYSDDSTLLVDAINGIIYGTVDANIDRGTNAFTLDADSVTVEVERQNDIILRSPGNSDNAQISITGDDSININSGNGSLYLSSLIDITLTATDGININSPVNTVIQGTAGFVGDLYGSVYGPDSTTVIDNNGIVIGEVNNSQVTTANLEASNFTDQIGTITGGAITDFSVQSPVYGTDATTLLVDVANNQVVGEVNADINRTGALTIDSNTSIAFNSGVGINAAGELVNSVNAAQPFTIASPVSPEKEFRAAPGTQFKQLYTNVSTGVYAIDSADTENVYWHQPSGAIVANITNLDTTSQRLRIIRIFINQGGTAFVPGLEINGVAQSFVNLGPVVGTVNTVNVFEFLFYRTHTSTWEVYCKQIDANSLTLDAVTGFGATTTNVLTTGGLDAGSGTITTTGAVNGGDATVGNIQVGVTDDNEIDTTTGNLTIDSAGGTVTVADNLTVTGNTTLQGNTIIGNAVTDTITIQTVTGTPLNTGTVSGYMEITINGTTRYVPYYT